MRQERSIAMAIIMLAGAALAGLILLSGPSQRATSGGARERCRDKLRLVGLALNDYRQAFGNLPPIHGEDGMTSWRVLLYEWMRARKEAHIFGREAGYARVGNSGPDVFTCMLDQGQRIRFEALAGDGTVWEGRRGAERDSSSTSDSLAVVITRVVSQDSDFAELEDCDIAVFVTGKSVGEIPSFEDGALVLFASGEVRYVSPDEPASYIRRLAQRGVKRGE